MGSEDQGLGSRILTPRPPSQSVAADTTVVMSAVLSRRPSALSTLAGICNRRVVLLSERSAQEAVRLVRTIAHRGAAEASLQDILNLFAIVPAATYAGVMPTAADTLRLAVASRNGSTADAHVLALAWATDSDVWSADRDFAGTGWPSWSTANLLRALDPEANEPAAQ